MLYADFICTLFHIPSGGSGRTRYCLGGFFSDTVYTHFLGGTSNFLAEPEPELNVLIFLFFGGAI